MKLRQLDIAVLALAIAAVVTLVSALNQGTTTAWIAFALMLLALVLMVIERMRRGRGER